MSTSFVSSVDTDIFIKIQKEIDDFQMKKYKAVFDLLTEKLTQQFTIGYINKNIELDITMFYIMNIGELNDALHEKMGFNHAVKVDKIYIEQYGKFWIDQNGWIYYKHRT